MPVSAEYRDFIIELLEPFGPVSIRAMFGGAGVFGITPEGKLMFGLIADDTLYFKTDERNRSEFEAEEAEEFIFELKGNRHVPSGYFRVPDRLLEDSEELKAWADNAFAVALRAAAKKPKKDKSAKRK